MTHDHEIRFRATAMDVRRLRQLSQRYETTGSEVLRRLIKDEVDRLAGIDRVVKRKPNGKPVARG